MLVSEYLLKWVSPNSEVVQLAGLYLLVFIPAALGRTLDAQFSQFCEAQNVALPSLYVNLITCVLTALLCTLFVHVFGLGGLGAALAASIGSVTLPALTVTMMLTYRSVRRTKFWRVGWCCLDGAVFWTVFRLALSSILSSLVIWFAGEAGQFISGRLGTTELAAQTVLTNFSMIFYCVPVGFGEDVHSVQYSNLSNF